MVQVVRWSHAATAYYEENLTGLHVDIFLLRSLKLDEINSTLISSEGSFERPIKPFKILAFIEMMPQKQLAGCLNSYKASLNPNKTILPNLLWFLLYSFWCWLYWCWLIIFATRHWLIWLLKAFQPHERLSVQFFSKFPSMVLKPSYFVQFSLTGLSHYLWGIFLSVIYFCPFFLSKKWGNIAIEYMVRRIQLFTVASGSPNFTKHLLLQTVQEDSKQNFPSFIMELQLCG